MKILRGKRLRASPVDPQSSINYPYWRVEAIFSLVGPLSHPQLLAVTKDLPPHPHPNIKGKMDLHQWFSPIPTATLPQACRAARPQPRRYPQPPRPTPTSPSSSPLTRTHLPVLYDVTLPQAPSGRLPCREHRPYPALPPATRAHLCLPRRVEMRERGRLCSIGFRWLFCKVYGTSKAPSERYTHNYSKWHCREWHNEGIEAHVQDSMQVFNNWQNQNSIELNFKVKVVCAH